MEQLPFRRFFLVKLPILKDTIILTTLLRAVWEFNNVDLIFTLTGGGPSYRTTTLTMYMTNMSVKKWKLRIWFYFSSDCFLHFADLCWSLSENVRLRKGGCIKWELIKQKNMVQTCIFRSSYCYTAFYPVSNLLVSGHVV